MLRNLSPNGLVGAVLRTPLRLVPPGSVVPVLSGPLRGRKWVAGSSVASCWLGFYESEKLEEMEAFVRPGCVFADIGAQAGYHSLLAGSLAGAGGAVYAFEPLRRNFDFLVRHLRLNKADNVEPVNAAVSDCEGELHFDPGPGFMAGRLSPAGAVAVRCVTLDGWIETNARRPPDVVKIDVEGAELRVLSGAERTLAAHPAVLMLDTHDFLGGDCLGLHDACCRWLKERNYRLTCTESTSNNQASTILAVPAN